MPSAVELLMKKQGTRTSNYSVDGPPDRVNRFAACPPSPRYATMGRGGKGVTTRRRTHHTCWMLGTTVGGVLATAVLACVVHSRGVKRVIFDRGGAGYVYTRVLALGEWHVPPGCVSQSCGVTDWGTRYTWLRRSCLQGSMLMEEGTVYFLWPRCFRQ
jgi:hypothetical protein